MLSAVLTIVIPSVRPSVCLSVRHTLAMCQNDSSYDHGVFTRVCTWLPGVRTAAGLRPQLTSATALFQFVSARRSTNLTSYHWRPCLSGGCCIYLEQSARVGTVFTITVSSAKQTQDRAFCPVLQLSCLEMCSFTLTTA